MEQELYDISEVARLFGLTPGGLRYYEQKGLIAPRRSEGGRRKYSRDDLSGLMYLKKILALSIPVDKTRELFHYDSKRSAREAGLFTLGKAPEARERADYYRMLADFLERHGRDLLELEAHTGQLSEVITEDYYLLALTPLFGRGAQIQAALARWIDIAPMNQICTVLTVADGRVDSAVTGFSVSKRYADQLALPLREQALALPSQPSLHTQLRVRGKERFGLDEEEVRSLWSCVKARKSWARMRLVYKFFYTHKHHGVREKFYKVWLNEA